MLNQTKIKIFFDGKCSICSREINYYRSIASKDNFIWCDLHRNSNLMKEYQLDYKQALLTLHAVDENGILHIGVDAFALIWKNIPRFHLLAKIVKAPGIYQLSKIGYRYFANWRFRRLKYCNLD